MKKSINHHANGIYTDEALYFSAELENQINCHELTKQNHFTRK